MPGVARSVQIPPAPRAGEVFTRRWAVDMVLDLAGYSVTKDLASHVALEPSCGAGAFVAPMVERLLVACAAHGRSRSDIGSAIVAVDLEDRHVAATRAAAAGVLEKGGMSSRVAADLAHHWVRQADFLLDPSLPDLVDFVIGNPPYIGLIDLEEGLREAYEDACTSLHGRSNVYVGFIEHGLDRLNQQGVLAYIVADRWMRNQYGRNLRSKVSSGFSVDAVIQVHGADIFERRVDAYPAVTVVSRRPQKSAVVAEVESSFGPPNVSDLVRFVHGRRLESAPKAKFNGTRLKQWFMGDSSWPSGSSTDLALVADLERRLPLLEDRETGTSIGIGLATGADDVFLTKDTHLVERDRLLPLALPDDLRTGTVKWSGTRLVNPWIDGELVALDEYPRLKRYLSRHRPTLRSRYVVRHGDKRDWYRTIDRVDSSLIGVPKLLLPDMKSAIHPVLEPGKLYPHHNLYYVVSDSWDLEVLGGLLLSRIANTLVGAYCVRMRGGVLRFQAQYLRRIRVPRRDSLSRTDERSLAKAFQGRDVNAASRIAARLYGVAK